MQQVTSNTQASQYKSGPTLTKSTRMQWPQGVKVNQIFTLMVNTLPKEGRDIKVKVSMARSDTQERLQHVPVQEIGVDHIFVTPIPPITLGPRAAFSQRERKCLNQRLPQEKWVGFLKGVLRGSPERIQLVGKNIEITHVQLF